MLNAQSTSNWGSDHFMKIENESNGMEANKVIRGVEENERNYQSILLFLFRINVPSISEID